jgi:hypothetical protein
MGLDHSRIVIQMKPPDAWWITGKRICILSSDTWSNLDNIKVVSMIIHILILASCSSWACSFLKTLKVAWKWPIVGSR